MVTEPESTQPSYRELCFIQLSIIFLLPLESYGINQSPQLVLSIPLSCQLHKADVECALAHQSSVHNYSYRLSPYRV